MSSAACGPRPPLTRSKRDADERPPRLAAEVPKPHPHAAVGLGCPLASLHHRGRRTGKLYTTPEQVFRIGDAFIVGLAYNRNAAWALNLLVAGGGEMTRGRKHYQITEARERSA